MNCRCLPVSAFLALVCATSLTLPAAAQETVPAQSLQYPVTGQGQTPEKYQGHEYSLVRIVRLSLIDGDVQVNRTEEPGWQGAQLNLPLKQGYSLFTGQGRAEVEFESGATARLAENSSLELRELALVDGSRITALALTQGTGTFYANLADSDSFVVITPHLVAQISRNARFRVDVTADGSTVGVLKGDVTVQAMGTDYRVTKNRMLSLREGDEQILLAKLGDADAWDRWVADRDEVLTASRERSSRYMNSGGTYYGASDLTNYGNWYNAPGYGWTWQPYGVGPGWMPYGNGYWYYLSGIGYSWYSYDPWGWMPYHFGSWVNIGHRGWCWVPGHFDRWRGARVFYTWNNNRVGWGPLGPNDRPGQTPTNLAFGAVSGTPGNSGDRIGPGGRMTRAEIEADGGGRVSFRPPDGFASMVRPMRGTTRADGDSRPGFTRPASESPRSTPAAAGFAGAAPTRGVTAEDRADLPRGGGRVPRAEAPAGIVYDPATRRYENGPATTSRPSGATPVSPSQGFGGDAGVAKPGRGLPPGIDRRMGDDSPARGTQSPSATWGNATPGQTMPRSNSTPGESGRTASPRFESPRYDGERSPNPRYESPRPPSQPSRSTSEGWGGRPSSPPPQTRGESPRPSPPPAPSNSGGGWGGGGSRPAPAPAPAPAPRGGGEGGGRPQRPGNGGH